MSQQQKKEHDSRAYQPPIPRSSAALTHEYRVCITGPVGSTGGVCGTQGRSYTAGPLGYLAFGFGTNYPLPFPRPLSRCFTPPTAMWSGSSATLGCLWWTCLTRARPRACWGSSRPAWRRGRGRGGAATRSGGPGPVPALAAPGRMGEFSYQRCAAQRLSVRHSGHSRQSPLMIRSAAKL